MKQQEARIPNGTIWFYTVASGRRVLHRDGAPAVIWDSGSKEWHQHGQLFREHGPALEFADGTRSWFIRGQMVRVECAPPPQPGGEMHE